MIEICKSERILVIGPCGAGKSTFSKKLYKILKLPLIHLDTYYHKPNWEEPEKEDPISIRDTPKFRLLELVRSLDSDEGIDPDLLVIEAGKERIKNPRLQLNKMIRRGILYVHLGRIHVT